MLIKLFVLCYLLASSMAWLAPERCAQSNKNKKRSITDPTRIETGSAPEIGEIAAKQHEALTQSYKDYQFIGVPTQASLVRDDRKDDKIRIDVYAPYNCSFHTYDPQLLSSVVCSNAACKLAHTVATVDTYTASEGYNWGVKISAKASFFEKTFEVGGEVSTGGTYSCTYTKGKTTTDLVECSDSSHKSGNLLLYNVKSDMICDFGGIRLESERRSGNTTFLILNLTKDEVKQLKSSSQAAIVPTMSFFVDTSKISDTLLRKILNQAPLFNPYTDLIMVIIGDIAIVNYLKKETAISLNPMRRIIPFTNKDGNSVYQYACIKRPY